MITQVSLQNNIVFVKTIILLVKTYDFSFEKSILLVGRKIQNDTIFLMKNKIQFMKQIKTSKHITKNIFRQQLNPFGAPKAEIVEKEEVGTAAQRRRDLRVGVFA